VTIPIAPLQSADLPDREQSLWRLTGPGAVMIGLAIGSGELILWPWITAKFGTEMMWAAALGVFLQLWINIEIGRWAISTGESAFTGFARVSRLWVYFFLSLFFISVFLPGWGRAAGTSLKILIFGIDGPGPDWFWTAIVTMLALVIIFGPRRIYATIEKSILMMVIVVIVGMVVVAVRAGTLADVRNMAGAVFSIGHIRLDEDFTFVRFFGAFVFAGAGGFGNLYYAYYLRDKGIGMGKRISVLLNPLREAQTGDSDIGYLFPNDDRNLQRFRDWFKYVLFDSTVFFWLANTFTMFLFMFGALVVLFPTGIVPEESQIIWDLALILEGSMGTWGRYLFLIVGIAALFSTVLATTDGGARLCVDLLHTNFSFARRFAANRLYLWFAITFAAMGVAATWFFDTFQVTVLDFFFINAVINGFAMAGYVPLMLYMNLKYLPKGARPRPINIVMVSIGGSVYISFAVYTIWSKIF
jgi:Mn2+/Fe2+ NRAMP family transporter